MQNKKSSLLKDAFALFAITLVAALALGFVYEITKEPIAKKEAEVKAKAYAAIYPEATMVDDKNEDLNNRVKTSADFLEESGFSGTTINEVCIAKDSNDNPIGYVMTITSHEGYGGDIKFTMGVKADGTLTKIEFVTIAETVGYGMEATKEPFKDQFTEVNTDQLTLIKYGVDKTSPSEINAISGATRTSKAVTNTVNAGLAFVSELINEGIGGVVRE